MAQNAFSVKWRKGVTAAEDNDGVADNWIDFKTGSGNSITITAADVNSQQLFKADFYVDGKVVSTSMFTITDTQDPMVITFDNNSALLEEPITSVTLRARLIARDSKTEVAGATFTFDAYNSRSTKIILSTAPTSNTVTVTTVDSDRKEPGESEENGDITIIAETTY